MKKLLCFLIVLTIVTSLLPLTALAEEWYIITGKDVRFRSSPEICEDNILGVFGWHQSVELLEISDDWAQVKAENTIGYVHKDYLGHVILPQSIGTSGITTGSVHFREGPSTSFCSLTVLSPGTLLTVIQREEDWYLVEMNQQQGYVHSRYVELLSWEGTILGVYATSFSTSQRGRSFNIAKAAGLVDGIILAPGENLSLLTTIGPITQANGYQEAPEFKHTEKGVETVTGYGGGVCQVATTLYQSVCSAQENGCLLTITERHRHSKAVSYVPPGKDATISWNAGQDFQFQNDGPYPIQLHTLVKDGTLICAIGTIANQ